MSLIIRVALTGLLHIPAHPGCAERVGHRTGHEALWLWRTRQAALRAAERGAGLPLPKACLWAPILTPLLRHGGGPVLPAPSPPSSPRSPTGAPRLVLSAPRSHRQPRSLFRSLLLGPQPRQTSWIFPNRASGSSLAVCLLLRSPLPWPLPPIQGGGCGGKGLQGKEAWSLAEICAVPSLQP